jgi:heme-degrading monooxygenase HmoA
MTKANGGMMLELLTTPPPMAAIARMTAIDGVRVVPTLLATQQGPDGHLGPEAAGAVLMLQATFLDEAKAADFWNAAAGLMESLKDAPGFIRRLNFTDGPHYTLLALWRTAADAQAFFSSAQHQAAIGDLYRHRWQYSHFAAIWELKTPRERVIFCQECDGVTPASDGRCRTCGVELFDPYVGASHADH